MGTEPVELARIDLGRGWATLTPVTIAEGRILGVAVSGGAAYAFTQHGAEAWFTHPPGLNLSALNTAADLDGDDKAELLFSAGRPAEPYGAAVLLDAESGGVRWRYDVEPMSYSWTLHVGKYMPGASGQQIIVLMHGYPPDPKNGYIALFAFDSPGQPPVQKWRYDFDAYTCFPSLLQTDLDGDGATEIVVETHSRMWFLDATTGEVKHFAQWDVSPANIRSYGLVKFTDLDKDGREDFLCIANFAQHHEVLLNRYGKMQKAWHHGWPESVTTGKVATKYPPVPDVDIDGDGHMEIVLSMFNADNEAAWALRVYDAITGDLKYTAPGAIAVSCVDVDGDGAAEILSNLSTDPTGTATTGAKLWKVKEGKLEGVWEDANAKALEGHRAKVQVGEEKMELEFSAASGYALGELDKEPKPAQPQFNNVPATVGNAMPTLLAAPLDAEPGCELVVYAEPKATVYCLREGAMQKKREYESSSAPAIADLDGDGTNELLLATASPTEPPLLKAITPMKEDALLWQSNLQPPERTGLPQPRKAYLRTIRLQGKPTSDIYAWFGTPVVRSLGIDGATGKVLWEKGEFPRMERYWGPSTNYAAAFDFNDDGAEDLVFTNPDYYCIADGRTGEMLLGPAYPPEIFKQPSQGLYTYPAVLRRDGDKPVVCLAGGHYFMAAMTIDAAPLWYKLPQPGENRCANEAYLQSRNGSWLAGYGTQDGKFAVVDVQSGKSIGELDIAASASDAIVWDADGDGQQEFICGDSHGTLHRISVGETGLVDSSTNLTRSPLGNPIAADFDGDNKCELALSTADGHLTILK